MDITQFTDLLIAYGRVAAEERNRHTPSAKMHEAYTAVIAAAKALETKPQEQVLNELRKSLKSADDAQECHADKRFDEALYCVNGVQDRLKRLIARVEAQRTTE